ncbi:uncharacterized protein LOC134274263 [Saccostrea cucullata]|uniref:uncharacterized protein LOC134274263 n=1 Tax=Saccostrea cuccullata TaxID=36930 RepID=UPI002ED6139F
MLKLIISSLVWIEVAIAYDPVIEQISPNLAIVGEKYSLLCKAEPLGNLSQINWSFSNGSTIIENEIFHLEGNIGEILIFKDVRKTFNGVQFVCFATSFENTTIKSKPFTLIVKKSISRIQVRQNSSDPAIAGQNYSLLCNVEPPRENGLIHWSLSNDSAIAENDAFKLDGIIGQTLTIEDVSQSYLGLQFICATIDVDNSTKKSPPFSLIVVASPVIEFFEDKIYSQSGQPFSKDCIASGYPYPVTKWYQDKNEVQQAKTSVFRSVLAIPTVPPNKRVNYTCRATVSLGSFVLSSNRTFTLVSYDNKGVQNREENFTNSVEYKYSVFIATILGVVLMILVLTGVLCGYLKIRLDRSKESDISKSRKKDENIPGSYVQLENFYEVMNEEESTNRNKEQKPQKKSDKKKNASKKEEKLNESRSGPSLKDPGKEISIKGQKNLPGDTSYYETPIEGTNSTTPEFVQNSNKDKKEAKVDSSSNTNEKTSSVSLNSQPELMGDSSYYEDVAIADEKKVDKVSLPTNTGKKHSKEHSNVPSVPFRDYPQPVTNVDERMPKTMIETSMENAGKKRLEKDGKSQQDKPRVQSVEHIDYDDVPNETTTVTVTNVGKRMGRSGNQSTMNYAAQKKPETTVKNLRFNREQLGVQIAQFNLYDDVPTENTNDKEMLIPIVVSSFNRYISFHV